MTLETLTLYLNSWTTTARDLFLRPTTTSESNRFAWRNNELTLLSAQEVFRQGWQEMLEGETRPIDELWEGIDAE